MKRKKHSVHLALVLGTVFGICIVAYTIDRTGGLLSLPMTLDLGLSDVYVNKAGVDVNPLVSLPAGSSAPTPPTQPVNSYEPSYNEIVTYIKKVNDKVVRWKAGPQLTDVQIRKIIVSLEHHCVTYGVNKYTILAMMTTESSLIVRIPSFLGAQYGRGLLQVSEIALKDFNDWTGKGYTVEDLYTIDRNIEVGVWVFNQNYYYGVETDFEHGAIIAYNVGANDYKKHKKDLLDQKFKGYDYNYLIKVQREYDDILNRDE